MICSMNRLEPNLIIGYTTRTHLLLDLDDTTSTKSMRLGMKIMGTWPKVGDMLIVRSSPKPLDVRLRYSWNNHPWMKRESDSYHLVFDNNIGYNLCCHICEALAELNILNKDYVKIRTFRGDMTLRVSHQNMSSGAVKQAPEPLLVIYNYKCKRRDGMIIKYLAFLDACRGLADAELDAETEPDQAHDRANDYAKVLAIDPLVKRH